MEHTYENDVKTPIEETMEDENMEIDWNDIESMEAAWFDIEAVEEMERLRDSIK